MTVQGVYAKDVRDWERELAEAGWKKVRLGLYKAPCGCLFRGPYGAWEQMKGTHLADHIAMGKPDA